MRTYRDSLADFFVELVTWAGAIAVVALYGWVLAAVAVQS